MITTPATIPPISPPETPPEDVTVVVCILSDLEDQLGVTVAVGTRLETVVVTQGSRVRVMDAGTVALFGY